MKNKFILIPALSLALLGGVAAGVTSLASADSVSTAGTTTQAPAGTHRGEGHMPGIFGTVSAVNGNSITVTSKAFGPQSSTSSAAPTTYTVDVTNAKVMKSTGTSTPPTASTVASIAVGDTVMVRGTVSGTSVTATNVIDGVFPGPGMGGKGGGMRGPGGFGGGVMGTVSSVNGTIVTVTTKDGGTYTIDASSATVKESGAASTLANVKVGDTVRIGGSITSATMTAKTIEDGVPVRPAQPAQSSTTNTTAQ